MKSYNAILLYTVCLIVGFCAGIVVWSQPITGDLTRIGAYPERWYGWNEPQQQIPNMGNTARETGKKHILVIGDSFSRSGRWQAMLSDRYSFTYLMLKKSQLAQVASYLRAHKPDAVVIQSVERFFPEIFGAGGSFVDHPVADCPFPANTEAGTSKHLPSLDGPSFPLAMRKTWPASGPEISQGYHLLRRWLDFRQHPEKRKPVTLPLENQALLSHSRRTDLLVIRDDLLLQPPLTALESDTIRCSVLRTAETLSSLPIPFVIALTPDKTTAYQPYLADAATRNRPATVELLGAEAIPHVVNMLPAFRSELASGTRDLYLPNDSHWGHAGFRLAASLIEAELQSQWATQHPASVQ
jgi:hypothetical protein